jgi:hypothetical protein
MNKYTHARCLKLARDAFERYISNAGSLGGKVTDLILEDAKKAAKAQYDKIVQSENYTELPAWKDELVEQRCIDIKRGYTENYLQLQEKRESRRKNSKKMKALENWILAKAELTAQFKGGEDDKELTKMMIEAKKRIAKRKSKFSN